MRNNKGSILIAAYGVLFVLLIIGGMLFNRTVFEKKFYDRDQESQMAFGLAEAGVDKALSAMKSAYLSYAGTTSPVAVVGTGEYEAKVSDTNRDGSSLPTNFRRIVATGYIPSRAQPRVTRQIEAIVKKTLPNNFFDYALYTAEDLRFSGQNLAYDVEGKAIYANTPSGDLSDICYDNNDPPTPDDPTDDVCSSPEGSEPAVTHDPSISPLLRFVFSALRAVAASQSNPNTVNRNNIYTAEDLKKKRPFPSTFYYNENPANGPNVVYVEGAMALSGGDVVGGLFLVVGNVTENPEVAVDSTVGGNITIDGAIYTRGEFTLNGGGGELNITGGVWAGGDILVDGGGTVEYSREYMDAIASLINETGAAPAPQIVSWKENEDIEII